MARKDEVWHNRTGGYIETTNPSGYDVLINGTNRYLNFGILSGTTGYGFRDNGGTMEYKNSGGSWAAIGSGGGGTGDVTGPASSTDNAIARFHLATGKLIQNSTVTIGDNGNISTTIANTGNVVGLAVVQNDTTNNPRGITIGNSGTGNSLYILPTGATGTSASSSGALLLDNTSNSGFGANIYSNLSTMSNALTFMKLDHASATGQVLRLDNDGTGNTLQINANGNVGTGNTTSGAVLINNTNNTGYAMNIYSNAGASAGALVRINAANSLFDQVALYIINNGTDGGAANIRLDGLAPQIEFVETDQVGTDGSGKFEAGVNGDIFYISGRNSTNTSFEDTFKVDRLANGGGIRLFGTTSGYTKLIGPATGGSGVLTLPSTTDTLVGRATSDTFTGTKTFNSNTLWDKGNMVFNVKAYGAVGDDSTNDTAAIQSAVDAAGAVGGVVWFPAGTYRIQTSALLLYTGSTPYSSITLAGAGAGKAIIKQMTTGVDVIKGLNNTTGSVQLLNVTIRDLTLSFGGTTTNSGNGIYLAQVAADGPSFQQMNFKNLILDNFGATGKYGFNAESLIVSSLENVMARSCANGFYLNGGAFGNYDSINTSVTFNNCYANGTNTVLGFNIYCSQYISFNACAADGNTTAAYNINDCSGISFNGCGVEWATGASASAYKFTAAVQCTINGGYIYQGTGTTTNAVYLTSTSTGITATGLAYYQDGGTLTNGFLVDAGSSVTNINCSFSGGTVTNQTNINATGVYKTPGTPRRTTETSSATPTINVGKTDVHTITALTTDITSMTTNLTGTAEDGQKLIISITGTASRAITWGASFEASGAVALPTTTSSTARLDVGFIWNAATTKWRCVASA